MVVRAGSPEVEPYLSRWGASAVQRCWPLHGTVLSIGRGSSSDVVIEGDMLVCIPS
jgi:hypothetical protein